MKQKIKEALKSEQIKIMLWFNKAILESEKQYRQGYMDGFNQAKQILEKEDI